MERSSKQPEMTKTIIDPETRRRRTVPASKADALVKQRFESERQSTPKPPAKESSE